MNILYAESAGQLYIISIKKYFYTTLNLIFKFFLQDKTNDVTDLSQINLMGTTIDVYKFIEKDPEHTFSGWKQRLLKQNSIALPQLSSKIQVNIWLN